MNEASDSMRRRSMVFGGAGLDRRGLLTALAAVLGAPATAAWAQASADDPAVLSTGEDRLDRLTVPALVNGRGPYPFVVDTGANHSAMSIELATALGLPAAGPVTMNTVAGEERTQMVRAASLTVGPRVSQDVQFALAPQRSLGAAGLLGLDQLASQRLKLDFAKGELTFAAAEPFRDPTAVTVRAQQRSGRLTLVNARLGGHPVTAFLDSGAEATLGNPALRRRLGGALRSPWDDEGFPKVPVISPTGQALQGELALAPVLRLGGLTIANMPVVFADLHTFRLWDLVDRPALILGVDVLRRFRTVVLDFARSEVVFRLPPDAVAPPTGTRLHGA